MQQPAKPGGAHTNAAVTDEPPDQTFDALPREDFFIYDAKDPSGPDYDPDAKTQLGSVFVDNNNSVLFTPPLASMFLPIPGDVDEISAITITPRNGAIVAEWLKYPEKSYHVVGINIDSKEIIFDFVPDSSTEKHRMLSWIDDSHILGEFAGATGSSYGVIDLTQKSVVSKAAYKNPNAVRIKDQTVNVYSTANDSRLYRM